MRKIRPGGTPGMQKNQLGSNLAQDASKSGFKEVLEAPWGCLGRPKREPSWSKIEAGRVFFWSWKGTRITSCFWMHFLSFWEPLGEAKTSISHWRGCKNQLFRKLRFNIVLRPVLAGFWGPSWSQVGPYKGSKRHVKVTSMLSWFFDEKYEFWTPRGAAAWAQTLVAWWEYCILDPKMQYFHWFFKGFAKSCLCARNEEVT